MPRDRINLPPRIDRQHLLAAIQRIDQYGFDPHQQSTTYDVVHGGKFYPPIAVVAFAMEALTDEAVAAGVIRGGEGTQAFAILRDAGFELVRKSEESSPPRMPRNPPWTREELILALDLYFRVGRKHEGPRHPEVIKLSQLLNDLPSQARATDAGKFRNPSGVAMKLGNFLAHDPEYLGAGLARGNKLEKQIWEEFAPKPTELREVANAIQEGIGEASDTVPIDDDEEFPEGEVLSRLHRSRERNRKAVARKKQKVLEETGKLECEACGFDFRSVYGPLGEGYAECHHIVPISELPGRKSVQLSDLAILCANCHRMIHRTRPLLGVAEFRDLIG